MSRFRQGGHRGFRRQVRPLAFGTWKEWSAPRTAQGEHAGRGRSTSGSRRSRRAKASLLSAGRASATALRRGARHARPTVSRARGGESRGRQGPRSFGIAASASAVDVMRPPNDFPPAKSASFGASFAALATAARTVAVATAGLSGRARPSLHVGELIAKGGDAALGKPLRGGLHEAAGACRRRRHGRGPARGAPPPAEARGRKRHGLRTGCEGLAGHWILSLSPD